MKIKSIFFTLSIFALVSCGEMNALQKSADYEYKYEAAKSYFVEGKYSLASQLFGDLIAVMKGTMNGEESLYLLAMSSYCHKDYESAAQYFRKYYQSYPKGKYVEYSRYYCGLAQYYQIPDIRLDQTSTYAAMREFQDFIDYYPYSPLKLKTQDMIYGLQDKLVDKEISSAKLYYDLGAYIGNCTSGGSNYEACIVTAENTLNDYPYAAPAKREQLSIMILRCKAELASRSIDEKKLSRHRDVVDEYYSFKNDYPESKYIGEAQKIFANSEAFIKKAGHSLDD